MARGYWVGTWPALYSVAILDGRSASGKESITRPPRRSDPRTLIMGKALWTDHRIPFRSIDTSKPLLVMFREPLTISTTDHYNTHHFNHHIFLSPEQSSKEACARKHLHAFLFAIRARYHFARLFDVIPFLLLFCFSSLLHSGNYICFK